MYAAQWLRCMTVDSARPESRVECRYLVLQGPAVAAHDVLDVIAISVLDAEAARDLLRVARLLTFATSFFQGRVIAHALLVVNNDKVRCLEALMSSVSAHFWLLLRNSAETPSLTVM